MSDSAARPARLQSPAAAGVYPYPALVFMPSNVRKGATES